MGPFDLRLCSRRTLRVEACEPRLVLAHPAAEVQTVQTHAPEAPSSNIHHGLSGVTYAHSMGLTGYGQTVAVIDSGIAYDHKALGGGFGPEHRVVGGWDFTDENDADPYDDAPAGLHGTHIAGILASEDPQHPGIAPAVDLVALRVFNDQGEGDFEWIENALRWVVNNQHNFEHPITTVNLSLGTKWQGNDVPQWAILEDEFRDLYEDGIFVAVAAGNDFQTQPVIGLSYPAASPHVVAVASHNQHGELSDFSRRDKRVLVAPGEDITSTAPDYLYDFNGVTDDFFTASGTSMATPFVSGASTLIRQALELGGNIDPSVDDIYQILQSTAGSTYDKLTDQFYSHVDLQAALDSIAPIDDYSSVPTSAHELGTIDTRRSVAGKIGTAQDIDYFSFTPLHSGTVRLQATSPGQLATRWHQHNNARDTHDTLEMEVRANQPYVVGIGSESGTGPYEVTISVRKEVVDLGSVAHRVIPAKAGVIYKFSAARRGTFSIDVSSKATDSPSVSLYRNSSQIDTGQPITSSYDRIDLDVSIGETLYFELSEDARITLANLVAFDGAELNVYGSAAADNFVASFGDQGHVSINGVEYNLPTDAHTTVRLHGGRGHDTLRVYLSEQTDSMQLAPRALLVSASQYSAETQGIENHYVYSSGGNETAYLYDSAGDDHFTGLPDYSVLRGSGFFNYVQGFASVQGYSIKGGKDEARLFDSAGNDVFTGQTSYSLFAGTDFRNYVEGFQRVRAYSNQGGRDRATLYDSPADDVYHGLPDYSLLTSPQDSRLASGFESVQVHAIYGGSDTAKLYDSPGDDHFFALQEYALMEGENYRNYAKGFDKVRGYSQSGGRDRARLYDSPHDDVFTALPNYAIMLGSDIDNYVEGFSLVRGYSNHGGRDTARLTDSAGNDKFHGLPNYAVLTGAGFDNYVEGFDLVRAYSHAGGNDEARLYGSEGDDQFHGLPEYAVLQGSDFDNYAEGFDRVFADGNQGGFDEARLYDSENNDSFVGSPNSGILSGPSYRNMVLGFDSLQVNSNRGGRDRATLHGHRTDRVFADPLQKQRITGIAYHFETHAFHVEQASVSTELHQTLARLVARDDFYRNVKATINSNDVRVDELLKNLKAGDRVISTVGFHAIDYLLEDGNDWTP